MKVPEQDAVRDTPAQAVPGNALRKCRNGMQHPTEAAEERLSDERQLSVFMKAGTSSNSVTFITCST
jgi:hypothetical protein